MALNSCQAQQSFTMPIGNQKSQAASINDIAWIAGSWEGEAFGGVTEEIWSEPLAGTMMGSFKLVNDDAISFYEFMTISEIDETLRLQIKHFDAALVGWEEKDKSVDFKFIKQEGRFAYFDNFTMEKVNEDHINIYVVISEGESSEEVKFEYFRK